MPGPSEGLQRPHSEGAGGRWSWRSGLLGATGRGRVTGRDEAKCFLFLRGEGADKSRKKQNKTPKGRLGAVAPPEPAACAQPPSPNGKARPGVHAGVRSGHRPPLGALPGLSAVSSRAEGGSRGRHAGNPPEKQQERRGRKQRGQALGGERSREGDPGRPGDGCWAQAIRPGRAPELHAGFPLHGEGCESGGFQGEAGREGTPSPHLSPCVGPLRGKGGCWRRKVTGAEQKLFASLISFCFR